MDTLKSIFSWLGKFLEKTRVVLLNIATAFILIVGVVSGITIEDCNLSFLQVIATPCA